MKGCKHRYVGEWLRYKNMSPWQDEPLKDDTCPKWKQQGRKIYMILPRWLAVKIAGIMQTIGRPMMNRVKN